jgi:transcriptional regulator with XRE-family HTH domain
MGDDIDLHLGKRLRRRRRLLGLTQQQVAVNVGIRFQQIQKYECGANRISAARLWQLAQALEVPVSYFYDGLTEVPMRREREGVGEVRGMEGRSADPSARAETQDLIRAYAMLGERPRRRLLDLARSLKSDTAA